MHCRGIRPTDHRLVHSLHTWKVARLLSSRPRSLLSPTHTDGTPPVFPREWLVIGPQRLGLMPNLAKQSSPRTPDGRTPRKIKEWNSSDIAALEVKFNTNIIIFEQQQVREVSSAGCVERSRFKRCPV
eukprot:m.85716 g.85716  ORF g.85716 m.85716 type:complete len:128 (-) comp19790_c0_seq1:2890-3273(-)